MITASQAQDNRDKAKICEVYGPLITRCAGRRLVADGYICPHCESDDPKSYCRSPIKGVKCKTKPD